MGREGKMGVHLDVPINGFAARLEVIEGPTGRRQRTYALQELSLTLRHYCTIILLAEQVAPGPAGRV